MTDKKYHWLLLAVFLLVYLLPLGARDLFVPDETRYGEIPREMIESGDWTVPRFNGVRYFEKPPLGYWLHAGSQLVFGRNNFAVRLPSALAVGLSALLILQLMGGGDHAGRRERLKEAGLAALVFFTSFEVFLLGTTALLDSLFALFLTAAIGSFFLATEEEAGSRREGTLLLLAGVASGLAFLTKGFLACALPALVLAPYLIWQRRYRDLFRMAGLPIMAAVITALPWSVLIHLSEPDFWRYFFWNEHVRRFMAADAQHKESFWFFFVSAPGMFLPWAFLVPAAAGGVWRQRHDSGRRGRLLRLALCWLILPFLFFSVSKGKLLTYILPCFPPFALLVTMGLTAALDRGRSTAFNWGVAANMVLIILLLAVLAFLQIVGFRGLVPFERTSAVVLVAAGLIAGLLFGLAALKKNRSVMERLLSFALAPVLLFSVVPTVMPGKTLAVKAPGPFLLKHLSEIKDDTLIIVDGETVGAACWFWQRDDLYMLEGCGELEYGFSYPDAARRLLDRDSVLELIRRNRGRVVLAARKKNARRWREFLPEPVSAEASGPDRGFVFLRY